MRPLLSFLVSFSDHSSHRRREEEEEEEEEEEGGLSKLAQ